MHIARCTVYIPYLTFSTIQAFKGIYKRSTTKLAHVKKDGKGAGYVKITSNEVHAYKTTSSRIGKYRRSKPLARHYSLLCS